MDHRRCVVGIPQTTVHTRRGMGSRVPVKHHQLEPSTQYGTTYFESRKSWQQSPHSEMGSSRLPGLHMGRNLVHEPQLPGDIVVIAIGGGGDIVRRKAHHVGPDDLFGRAEPDDSRVDGVVNAAKEGVNLGSGERCGNGRSATALHRQQAGILSSWCAEGSLVSFRGVLHLGETLSGANVNASARIWAGKAVAIRFQPPSGPSSFKLRGSESRRKPSKRSDFLAEEEAFVIARRPRAHSDTRVMTPACPSSPWLRLRHPLMLS